MAISKITLPRHTNLARHGYRIVAAIIDFAIMFAYFLILGAGTFTASYFITKENRNKMEAYQYESGLRYKDEDGVLSAYNKSDFLDYRSYDIVLQYYYLHYLTGDATPIEVAEDIKVYLPDAYYVSPNKDEQIRLKDGSTFLPKDYYTVSWYNANILSIGKDPDNEKSTSLFTYQKDTEGHYDLTKIGIAKEVRWNEAEAKQIEISAEELKSPLFKAYGAAYSKMVLTNHYYKENTRINFFNSLAFFIAFSIAGALSYILVPMIRKDGATFGKMIFKLGLANIYGYKHKRYQILMRFIPFILTVTAVCFIPFVSEYVLFLIALVILLVSFAIMMASPRRVALHDLTAQTIVVEANTSKLFETRADEIAYTMDEDRGILIDNNETDN